MTAAIALGKTRRDFAHAKEFEADGGAPIIERRLLEPGLAVEARRDPIAGLGHVAGDPCVARFVGADKPIAPRWLKIANVKSDENEDEPDDARGETVCRHWRRRGRFGRRFCRHAASLARRLSVDVARTSKWRVELRECIPSRG